MSFQYFSRRRPLVRVYLHQLRDYLLLLFRGKIVELQFWLSYHVLKKLELHHFVVDYSQLPHIGFVVVRQALQHFRRAVLHCPNHRLRVLLCLEPSRHSEICYLRNDLPRWVFVQQDVLRFQVSVNNPLVVDVLQPPGDVPNDQVDYDRFKKRPGVRGVLLRE